MKGEACEHGSPEGQCLTCDLQAERREVNRLAGANMKNLIEIHDLKARLEEAGLRLENIRETEVLRDHGTHGRSFGRASLRALPETFGARARARRPEATGRRRFDRDPRSRLGAPGRAFGVAGSRHGGGKYAIDYGRAALEWTRRSDARRDGHESSR